MKIKNVVLKITIATSMLLLVHSSQDTGGDSSDIERPRRLRRSLYYSIQNKAEPKRVEPDYLSDLTLEEDLDYYLLIKRQLQSFSMSTPR
eukprot:scaffold165648_cov53-Attheya_sp.AAC.4